MRVCVCVCDTHTQTTTALRDVAGMVMHSSHIILCQNVVAMLNVICRNVFLSIYYDLLSRQYLIYVTFMV